MTLFFEIFSIAIATACSSLPDTIYSFYIASDSSNIVTSVNNPNGINSIGVFPYYPHWEIPYFHGGDWIWDKASADVITCTFFKIFNIPGNPILALLEIATDDGHQIMINDVNIGQDTILASFYHVTIDVLSFVKTGTNTLKILVRNDYGPGGLLYKLTVNCLIK